jgi:hypothetical protein
MLQPFRPIAAIELRNMHGQTRQISPTSSLNLLPDQQQLPYMTVLQNLHYPISTYLDLSIAPVVREREKMSIFAGLISAALLEIREIFYTQSGKGNQVR